MKKTYSISLLLLSIISLLATFKGCMLFLKPQQGAGNYELSLTIATVIFATTTIYRIIYNFSMKKAETMDEVMALEVDISNILFKINEVLIILLFIFAFSDMGREATIFGLFFDGYDSKEFFLYIFYLLIWIVPSFIINAFKGNTWSKLSYWAIASICIIMSFSANIYFSEAVNKHVVIDHKEIVGGGRGGDGYFIDTAEKTFNPIAVNSPEFNSLEVGDEKVFCSHKSIFGVSFLDIKNDDNQKCKYKNDMLPMKKEKRTVGLLLYGVFPLLFLAFALINTFNHRYIFQFSGIELPYGCRRKVEEARFRGNKENDITITSLKAMSISKNYIIRKNNLKRTKKTLPEIIGNNYFKYGMDRTLQHIDFPKCWYCVISDPSSKTVLIYELEKNKIWIIDDSMDLVDYSAEEEIDADDETEVDKETEAEECIEKFLEIHFKEWEISWFHVEPMTVYDSNRIAQEY